MMTRKELLAAMERFEDDPHRVVSVPLLCEVAGISEDTWANVRAGKYRMTELVQIRVEAAMQKLERGELKVMRRPDRTKYITYRKAPQPEFKRTVALTFKAGKIGIKTGLENANSYRKPTFREEFDGNS